MSDQEYKKEVEIVLDRLEQIAKGGSVYLYQKPNYNSPKDPNELYLEPRSISFVICPSKKIEDTYPDGSLIIFDSGEIQERLSIYTIQYTIAMILTVLAGYDVYIDDNLFDPLEP